MLKAVINRAIMNINLEDIDFHSVICNAVYPVAMTYKSAEIYRLLHIDLGAERFIKFVLSR